MAAELPNSRIPPPEADCLAWVEGEPLPRDREQALARALGEDRVLARKLEAMRADRAAIKAMPEVAAPAGLMAAVEASLQPILERQMLLGLRDGASVSDLPPISIVQPVKRSIMQAFFADRVGRRLAAAAALLLMVGGVTYFGTTYLSGRTAYKPGPTVARGNLKAAAPEVRVAEASPRKPEEAAKEKTGAPAGDKALALAPSAPETPGVSSPEEGVRVADASEFGTWAQGPFLPDLDGARAAELARQGRLIIRVTAVDPTFRNGGVAERIRRADSSVMRLADDVPPTLVEVLAPPAAPQPMGPDPEPGYSPTVVDDSPLSVEPAPSFVAPQRSNSWTPPPEQSVYLVQIRLDGAALDTLRGTLSGGYGEAQYEELADPLQEGTAAVNPNSVVWWTQSPAGWNGWAGVPVVVDARH